MDGQGKVRSHPGRRHSPLDRHQHAAWLLLLHRRCTNPTHRSRCRRRCSRSRHCRRALRKSWQQESLPLHSVSLYRLVTQRNQCPEQWPSSFDRLQTIRVSVSCARESVRELPCNTV